MNFDFTSDQHALRDAVAKWVERDFAFERRHALTRQGGYTREVYAQLCELGLGGLVISSEHGGLGMGPIEAMVVMEELGRGLVNAPYAHAALVAPALLSPAAPVAQQWLPRMASGQALVVPAFQERHARYRLHHVDTQARATASGPVLSGHKSIVAAGDEADAFIVSARHAGATEDHTGIGLYLVPRDAAGLQVRGYPTQDGARAAEVMFQDTPAEVIAQEAWDTLEWAGDVGLAAACAEGVGLMEALMALTINYMNTRKQFGVPIASFQALRHRLADVKMQLELGRSMSYLASLRLTEPSQTRRRALSQAKVQLGRSMRQVGQECIQFHGGIGVTDEYVGSHYFKRLTMLEMAWGDTLHHLGEVSSRMTDSAGALP